MRKETLVQIGCDFYKLDLFKSITTPKELKDLLNKYDVRLLREEEWERMEEGCLKWI